MEVIKPTTVEDHKEVLAAVRAEAEALPPAEVGDPDMPVRTFLDEASTAVEAAKQHAGDLEKVGLTGEAVEKLDRYVRTLHSAQVLWNTERGVARSEAVTSLVDDSEDFRRYLLDASDLALRGDGDARARLSLIREGEGLADLSADLSDLAVLVTENRPLYEAIKVNADEVSQKAAGLRDGLKSALAEEDVAKTLSGYKVLRDRCFVLAKRALSEVRAFARFAFRDDKSNARRHLFSSAYRRARDRRARKSKDTAADLAQSAEN